MNKTAIKNFAIAARRKLIASVQDKAGRIGITRDKITDPISQGEGFAIFPTHIGIEAKLTGKEVKQRENLVRRIKSKENGYDLVMEEVAYTWFNRIIAVRFMEVNDYLPSRIRVLSSETKGKFEPDIVTQAPKVDLKLTPKEIEEIIALKEKNALDQLFRMLFIKQCNELGEILPKLFEATSTLNNDYTEILFDVSYTKEDGVIRDLLTIDEEDFLEAVEIIGWMYQYYNEERRNEVINIYKGTIKKEDIPAATQLFTTDWVVRYMVDNSLGRYWIERNKQSKLGEKLAFFVKPRNCETAYVGEKVVPKELTFFDPCMGSGHILVYAFDVLMEIYRECGFSDRDAAVCILQDNLYGLDIDDRAYQLAYFAVMMKARSYNRRVLTMGISPNICAIQESNGITNFAQDGITFDSKLNGIGEYLIKQFRHAKEIGSLQTVDEKEYNAFEIYLLDCEQAVSTDVFSSAQLNQILNIMRNLVEQAKIMSKKYAVVCTNPPYMNKFESHLKEFVINKYKPYSSDMFSVFIYRNFSYCMSNGYSAFMTPFVWMFIKTYENLRDFIINNKSITTLIQMEYSAFEEATVPICSFVLQNEKNDQSGCYLKLTEFKGGMEVQRKKFLEAIADEDCEYFYETNIKEFAKIPGMPIAYWASNRIRELFSGFKQLGDLAAPKIGMRTGDNKRFLRMWYEVSRIKLGLGLSSAQAAIEIKAKWIQYNKGGEYRKWYGNNEYVVNWENDGKEIKDNTRKNYPLLGDNLGWKISNEPNYFQESITWSFISSSKFGVRYSPTGAIFDVGGSSIFAENQDVFYITAFLGSSVAFKLLEILNPTLNFQVNNISSLPLLFPQVKESKIQIDLLTKSNINISKSDWDSFEISWDYKKHPLVKNKSINKISDAFAEWKQIAESQFKKMKFYEEELNRIFIEIYGLQDELTPEVEDKDITIRKADLQRDIRSFISYAIGCMVGRYSLDFEGLAYAGGEWDESKYTTFIPDTDNILPITDNEYFSDDIVACFVEFVKVVYGQETLEENLDFIAQALGNKGNTSREIIRNYFLKDFYADHVKIYQKRPIYWLFDSGKENGFKALIYMHRYDQDTVGRVRTDYLHRTQSFIENATSHCDVVMESSAPASEKSKAVKQKEKLVKQLAETRLYDQAISHIAHKRMAIDLDDGVVVNYAKFQGVEVASEGKKSVKIDLLAKI